MALDTESTTIKKYLQGATPSIISQRKIPSKKTSLSKLSYKGYTTLQTAGVVLARQHFQNSTFTCFAIKTKKLRKKIIFDLSNLKQYFCN